MNETCLLTPTRLRWVASHSTNCFHVADAIRRGWPLADPEFWEVLAEPTERLRETLRAESIDEEPFWAHLLPLSANIENNTQLVQLVLRKTLGPTGPAQGVIAALAGRVADVEATIRGTMPELLDRLAAQADPFAMRWLASGPAMLHSVARQTDARLIVPEADAILVPPVLGGNGVAHLLYNSVRIEAVEGDPVPELPEVVRLAWLVSQLNVDVPMFSEMIHRDRLPLVASMAMLPPTLEAAAEARLVDNEPALLALALESWYVAGPPGVDLADVASTWWESHLDLRPPWHVALAALDRMIFTDVA